LWVGKLLDRDYRSTAKEVGLVINRVSGDDLSRFPIEKARLRSIWYLGVVNLIAVVGYGWALDKKVVGF